MTSAIDDFYDFHKDVVKNTSTGLMTIRDLATYYNVLVDIHFTDHRINITVRSKKGPLRGIKEPTYYFDIITEYATKEMTLDEIEKELGYKVKIVNKKKGKNK